MTEYVLSTGAELDLDEIWEYIAQDNIDSADRWIGKLFDAFEAIARNPGIGHTRRDLTEFPVQFWPVGAYLIIYRNQSNTIEIVAVTHGARDVPSFLRQRAQ
jgi:plasmid stabilization system protein ParE